MTNEAKLLVGVCVLAAALSAFITWVSMRPPACGPHALLRIPEASMAICDSLLKRTLILPATNAVQLPHHVPLTDTTAETPEPRSSQQQ